MEKDNDFDTESEEGGKGGKKKWGRSKEKPSTEASLAGDKEVSPAGRRQAVGLRFVPRFEIVSKPSIGSASLYSRVLNSVRVGGADHAC